MQMKHTEEYKNTYCRITNKRTEAAFNKLALEERRAFIKRNGKNKCFGCEVLNFDTMEKHFSPKIGNFTFNLWKFKTAKEAQEKAIEIYNKL